MFALIFLLFFFIMGSNVVFFIFQIRQTTVDYHQSANVTLIADVKLIFQATSLPE